jgi:hypothetical protein
MSQVVLVPILLWVAALVCAASQSGASRARFRVVLSSTGCCVIFSSFRSAFRDCGLSSATCFSPSAPRAPSPFQYEVGVTNHGLGLAALYAAFRGFEARLAVGIAAACFLFGAGIGHIPDIAATGNFAPGNAGPIMVTDFLTPIAVLALLYFASEKWKPKSPARLRWRRNSKTHARRCANIARP